MSIPNFAEVALNGDHDGAAPTVADTETWTAEVASAAGQPVEEIVWSTPEGIDVKPVYTRADLDDIVEGEHPYPLGSFPGATPYLRGPYPTMYVNQPWTIRQYAGFSTASE
nr:methylmalonyl-CoA mutase family protein [Actinomycetota bacterium]